jgi:hypothetical protein
MAETHPEKRLMGYARVSTVGQTLDSQLEQRTASYPAAVLTLLRERHLDECREG